MSSSSNKSILMTRAEVAEYFGVSVRSVIRMEEKKKLRPIKLSDSKQASVYYKRSEVYAIIFGKEIDGVEHFSDLSHIEKSEKNNVTAESSGFSLDQLELSLRLLSLLSKRISEFRLSNRALNALNAYDIEFVADLLIEYESRTLLKFRGVGKDTVKEVDDLIKDIGLQDVVTFLEGTNRDSLRRIQQLINEGR